MKLNVKKFAAKPTLDFEELSQATKSVKIAENRKTKIEYWYDPKTSCIYGYLNGRTTNPVSEYAIKDQDYLDAAMDMLTANKNIKIV